MKPPNLPPGWAHSVFSGLGRVMGWLALALALAACAGEPPAPTPMPTSMPTATAAPAPAPTPAVVPIAGFLIHLRLADPNEKPRCEFPNVGLTACRARPMPDGTMLYEVAAADLHNWWGGQSSRLRLVTIYHESPIVEWKMIQVDGDDGSDALPSISFATQISVR